LRLPRARPAGPLTVLVTPLPPMARTLDFALDLQRPAGPDLAALTLVINLIRLLEQPGVLEGGALFSISRMAAEQLKNSRFIPEPSPVEQALTMFALLERNESPLEIH
jgi:hypothetical protein